MPKQIKFALAAILVLLLMLFGLSYLYFKESSRMASGTLPNALSLSSIEIEDENGKTVVLKDVFLKNHGALLSFWATWCEPCLKEIPRLLVSKMSTGHKLIWINLDYGSFLDRRREVGSWKLSNKITLGTFFDGQGQLSEKLQIAGLPLNLMISSEGKILWSKVGILSDSEIKELEAKSADL